MPIFIWEFGSSPDNFIYGFPAINGPEGGIKVATEIYAQSQSPDGAKHPPTPEESERMYQSYIAPNLPWLGSQPVRSASCWYTTTPEHHFLIDQHPDSERVIIVSPCSGHGFKHSPAIGESVAQLALEEKIGIDLSPFAWPKGIV